MNFSEYRKFAAFGTGIGIEIRGADLEVVVARVRPSGVEVAGRTSIRDFRERPAADWGAEYAGFLKKLGEGRLSAAVLLPRGEVIVRQLALPGVARKDHGSAIALELDSLHPFGEEDVVHGWSPLPGGVLVAVLRRAVMDRYMAMFEEAGVAVGALTFSGVAIHGAARLFGTPPPGFIAVIGGEGGGVEVYGESPSRALFSAEFDVPPARAVALGIAELRLPHETVPATLDQVLPRPHKGSTPAPLAYAAAIAGACPRLAPVANLLPAERRAANSRAMFIPTAILAALLVLTMAAAVVYSRWADHRYLGKLQEEIAGLEPQARRAAALDAEIALLRARARLLDEFRDRTRQDLEALNELSVLLPPPIWTNSIELGRDAVNVNGEAEQAVGLLKVIDASPLFHDSDFAVLARSGSNELFRIRTKREVRK
jgi:hypothetical protein